MSKPKMTILHVAVLEFNEDKPENIDPYSSVVGVYDDKLTAVRNGLKAEILQNLGCHSMKYLKHDYLDFYEIIEDWTLSMLLGPDITEAREDFLGCPEYQVLSTGFRLILHEVELNANWSNGALIKKLESLKSLTRRPSATKQRDIMQGLTT